MVNLHSLLEKVFDKNSKYYGNRSIEKSEFIYCSDLDTYKLVAPNFKDEFY